MIQYLKIGKQWKGRRIMHITVTEAALQQLKQRLLSAEDRIRLVYDAEGCGCAVSGIASLWIVNTSESDEIEAETNADALPFSYLRRHEVFFEERLLLDYSPGRRAYRLSSDGQIYSSSIVLTDRRAAALGSADAPR
jgi:uncharacterized protein YqkB